MEWVDVVEAWYVVLIMLCTAPPCLPRYDPVPWPSMQTCIVHGKLLAREHKAVGVACARKPPKRAIKLPGRMPPGKWA